MIVVCFECVLLVSAFIVFWLLFVVCCNFLLFVVCCVLFVGCLLLVACCLLLVACFIDWCLLFVVCYIPSGVLRNMLPFGPMAIRHFLAW